MKSGQLRHYITIQQWIETGTDSLGASSGSFQTLYENVPASITMTGGSETELANQIIPENRYTITMRYLLVDQRMRIRFREKLFNIESVDNINFQNRELKINVIEVENRQLTAGANAALKIGGNASV